MISKLLSRWVGPNGLLPLAHQNRTVTEHFGNSWAETFCDLSRKLPRHRHSDHLMSFKIKHFTLPTSVICTRVVLARKSFLRFLFCWLCDFLISEAGAKKGPKRSDGYPNRKSGIHCSPKPLFFFGFLGQHCCFMFFAGGQIYLKAPVTKTGVSTPAPFKNTAIILCLYIGGFYMELQFSYLIIRMQEGFPKHFQNCAALSTAGSDLFFYTFDLLSWTPEPYCRTYSD